MEPLAHIEVEPVYDATWFRELGSYLLLMSDIQQRIARTDRAFDDFVALAGSDRRLFFDARWHDGYRECLHAMEIVASLIDDAKPSDALGEVYLLFKYQQIAYALRTLSASKALDYLSQAQFDLAGEELAKFKEATHDLARMAAERDRILDPLGRFAALREYIAQKKLERARVAANET
jgi:hypothetical protein